ncbi:hypothetical protein VdG1_04617, partial [Verticillium dahliae VDG1]
EDMVDAPAAAGKEEEAPDGKVASGQPAQAQQSQQGHAQGGAGKKKKKGKK